MQTLSADKSPTLYFTLLQRLRYRRVAFGAILAAWPQRRRQRRQLLGLSEDQLRDTGISRADAVGEGHKPFWKT